MIVKYYGIMEGCKDKSKREVLVMQVAFTCWNIWKERCEVVFGKKEVNVYAVILWIKTVLREAVQSIEVKQGNDEQKGTEVWKTLEEGWYKVNYDSGFVKDSGLAGLRVVVRNENGILIDGVCEAVKADGPLLAEALAVKKGIKLAVEKGYQKVKLEMDSEVVYTEILKNKQEGQWKIRLIMKDIHRLLSNVQYKNFIS